MNNKYTTHEINFLIRNYPNYGWKYCADAIDRTESSIKQKIAQLRNDGLKMTRNRDFVAAKGVDRPVKLENIYSNRILKSNSIANFCREARLYHNAKFHINPILSGDRLSYKNWFLPEVLNKELELIDVYNNEYNLTIKELILKYKLSSTAVGRLLNGESIKGLHLKENFERIKNKIIPAKNYKVKKYIFEKDGKVISGETMKEVGEKIGRSIAPIFEIVHGYKESQDGYKLKEIVFEQKSWL